MRIGIMCPSEIAFRRFMPALTQVKDMRFIGIAVNTPDERYGKELPDREVINSMLAQEKQKAQKFIDAYGGKLFGSYDEIISSKEIDALYVPLPPGLHFKWAKRALMAGKHVLVEKPSTINASDTMRLTEIAREKGLAIHENYMFSFHAQLDAVDNIIRSGELGSIRLYRVSFGFPMRERNDFRYVQALGGGALMDAGGYVIKYAYRLLGDSAKIVYAQLNDIAGFEVDMFGSGVLVNDEGTAAQIAFGMDNAYKCELEVWGSKGCLTTGRILTAPAGFEPTVTIRTDREEVRKLPSDDAFKKSIEYFVKCIENKADRIENYSVINNQAQLVENFLTACHGY